MFVYTISDEFRQSFQDWRGMPSSLSGCRFRVSPDGALFEACWRDPEAGETYPPVTIRDGDRLQIWTGRPPTMRVATPPRDAVARVAWEAGYNRAGRQSTVAALVYAARGKTYHEHDVARGNPYRVGTACYIDDLDHPTVGAAERGGIWMALPGATPEALRAVIAQEGVQVVHAHYAGCSLPTPASGGPIVHHDTLEDWRRAHKCSPSDQDLHDVLAWAAEQAAQGIVDLRQATAVRSPELWMAGKQARTRAYAARGWV